MAVSSRIQKVRLAAALSTRGGPAAQLRLLRTVACRVGVSFRLALSAGFRSLERLLQREGHGCSHAPRGMAAERFQS